MKEATTQIGNPTKDEEHFLTWKSLLSSKIYSDLHSAYNNDHIYT